MTTAMLLIDIQNDYFPAGRMELEGSVQAGANAGLLLAFCRDHKVPVAHIQHISARPGATFFLPDTFGAEIHKSVSPRNGEPVFVKHYPNSFKETDLLKHLNDTHVERLVVAGMMTHMCVDATVRAATDFGFHCQIAHDACATRALSFNGATVAARDVHHAFLAALNGAYGRVMSVDEIMKTLNEPR